MIAAARLAAYDALLAVETGRLDLPQALHAVRGGLPDERDRALAGEIATGALRWQGAFDHLATAFTGRALAKLDREVRTILRLTLFQLLHLDRVPPSAAVNDAVSLAKRAGKRSAAPMVNAVLRRVLRERGTLPLPPRPADPRDMTAMADYVAVTLSQPRWLVERWLRRYGFEAAEVWARFNNSAAPLVLRVNRLRTTPDGLVAALAAEGVVVEPARFAPDGMIVTRGNPLLTSFAGDGSFFIQDEASQLVAAVVAARPGEQILDTCASPGGKTTALAADMADTGLLAATDVRGRRVDLLARTVAVSGARNIRVLQADAARPLPFRPVFDAVLLDAPCSGLGVIRRDPDVKWRRTEDSLATLAEAQGRLLSQAADVVRPGGRLIYATCSSEPEENEEVVDAFLTRRPDFREGPPPSWAGPASELLDERGRFRPLPHRDGLESFFAVTLVKSAGPQ